MAAKRFFTFTSGAEARAFIQGVECAEIEGTYWVPGVGKRSIIDGVYVVLIMDTDKPKSSSDPTPKHWKKRNPVKIER